MKTTDEIMKMVEVFTRADTDCNGGENRMSLPPLPKPMPYGYIARTEHLFTDEQMREYGKLCRKQALDEIYVYAPECGAKNVSVASKIVDPVSGKMSESNARLIAAAPDLLEACVYFEEFGNMMESRKKIASAIAKATGCAA